jgi:hypothetical protein
MPSPTAPPISAVTVLTSMLVLNASTYGWWTSRRMLSVVQLPSLALNAPSMTLPAGKNRNRNV